MIETVRYLLGLSGSSGYGSKSTADHVTDSSPHLRSLTAIVTGATSGIGEETARILAKRGARVVIPARSLKSAEDAKARITAEFPGSEIVPMTLDLSSLGSVRTFVSEFERLDLPLNLLINNAGRFSYEHGLSEDGIEMTFATNYLGHFLLTKMLTNRMIETASASGIQGRIVNVSSGIHGWFSGDPIRYLARITRNKRIVAPAKNEFTFSASSSTDENEYDPARAYALSKLANVLHMRELSIGLKKVDANVTANCVNPGIVRTRILRDREGFVTDMVYTLMSKLLKTIPQAAATTCYVATHPRLTGISGKYFSDCNEASPSGIACDSSEAARLWSASEIMTSDRSATYFFDDLIGPT